MSGKVSPDPPSKLTVASSGDGHTHRDLRKGPDSSRSRYCRQSPASLTVLGSQVSLQVLPQTQTGEKHKLQNLLEMASLFLSSEARPWDRGEWLALACSVACVGEGPACRPGGLTPEDTSEGNCQPLLPMGIGVAAGGAAEGAHLQKRLGMRFLSPFPCFHGNSSKQQQAGAACSEFRCLPLRHPLPNPLGRLRLSASF